MTVAPPVATYRLQLHAGFGFDAAAETVPYLAELGISHLYLSPIWAATPGSTHGYDVIDHARINEELGGIGSFYALCHTARAHGLGVILDIVPNHVGIAQHPWWRDVLRFGPESQFAPFFDITWEGQPQQQTGVLVYPVLGQPFGAALEAGELLLEHDGAELVLRYYDATFPLSPKSYATVLGLPPPDLDPLRARDVLEVLAGLQSASPVEAALLTSRLADHVRTDSETRNWVIGRTVATNGQIGDPESFNELEAVLKSQHYRLAYWRVSAEEINYRRFFDINDLAAVRVELDAAFDATHSLVKEIVAGGLASGLRIDHIDGLYNPAAYLARLRELTAGAPDGPPAIWVEKILARDEALPVSWPVEGTSGYDFLAMAGGLFVDSATEQAFSAIYEQFTGVAVDFETEAFGAKRRIAARSFAGEVMVLALHLYRLAQRRRLARDNTLGALREAIAALLSTLPVYRTYLENDEPMPGDGDMIRRAAGEALRRDTNITPEAMAFLVQVLLLETADSDHHERGQWTHFRRRFQQLSGPVMAKGVEDTAFFRYHRLIAGNEVGDDPAHFGVSAESAHRWFAERARSWQNSLSATTTHDTKRSEDARMRLAAITSTPRSWHREVRSWARSNARHQRGAVAQPVPDRNTEYYLYQTLVASWDGPPTPAYIARIEEHMIKAAREGKLRTSWSRIDEGYEAALRSFVRSVLARRNSAAFIKRLTEFVASIESIASVNALGLLALKVTAPGIPDFFQGSEFSLHTLTDPDNRGDVDYEKARSAVTALSADCPLPTDPLAKPWLTRRLLRLRRSAPELFAHGTYRPLRVSGPAENSLFAYERQLGDSRCVVVVVIRPGPLIDRAGMIDPERLAETTVEMESAERWRDYLSAAAFDGGQSVPADKLLSAFPLAILVAEPEEANA